MVNPFIAASTASGGGWFIVDVDEKEEVEGRFVVHSTGRLPPTSSSTNPQKPDEAEPSPGTSRAATAAAGEE